MLIQPQRESLLPELQAGRQLMKGKLHSSEQIIVKLCQPGAAARGGRASRGRAGRVATLGLWSVATVHPGRQAGHEASRPEAQLHDESPGAGDPERQGDDGVRWRRPQPNRNDDGVRRTTTADDHTPARGAAWNAVSQGTTDKAPKRSCPDGPFQADDSAYNGHSGAVSPVQRRSSVGRARDS